MPPAGPDPGTVMVTRDRVLWHGSLRRASRGVRRRYERRARYVARGRRAESLARRAAVGGGFKFKLVDARAAAAELQLEA